MICPHCREKIEDNLDICPICGEKILSVVIDKKLKSFEDLIKEIISCRPFKITIIAILAILIISIVTIGLNNLQNADPLNATYKSITQTVNTEDMDFRGAIQAIYNLEKDLSSYFTEDHSIKNNDKLFLLFLRDIHEYSKVATIDATENIDFFDDSKIDKNFYIEQGILFKYKYDEDGGFNNHTFILISPSLNSIKYVSEGEGSIGPKINYKNLTNLYSRYLSKELQDYLKIKCIEEKDLNGSNYFAYGSGAAVNSDKLVDWIVYWQDFLKKYPKFIMKQQIKKNIAWYSSELVYTKYGTFCSLDDDIIELDKHAKKSYEDALARFDKKSKEYKDVKKIYDYLKKNNFKVKWQDFQEKYNKAFPYLDSGYFEDY